MCSISGLAAAFYGEEAVHELETFDAQQVCRAGLARISAEPSLTLESLESGGDPFVRWLSAVCRCQRRECPSANAANAHRRSARPSSTAMMMARSRSPLGAAWQDAMTFLCDATFRKAK
jgi:hypothetical protein